MTGETAGTTAVVENTTSYDTTAVTKTETEAVTAASETQPEKKEINIATADELRSLSSDGKDYEGYTINLTADIDISDKEWIPMDGTRFFDTTFNGNNHTVSGMTIVGKQGQTYLGFISATMGGSIIFKDLSFKDVNITSYGKECAVFVGQNMICELTFNNVSVSNVKIDGYTEYLQNSSWISFRIACFVGGNWNLGIVNIDKCSVSDFTASGFHNLAAFVGYDGVGNGVTVTNSSVKNMTLTFSYCRSANYKIDQNKKYVQIFYNAKDWSDTLAPCQAAGNTYENVVYIDYTTGTHYNPDTFRTVS